MNVSYHWSPSRNHDSIIKRGLLVPKLHPRLTDVVTCSEGHRNPHVSLGMTPIHAWNLSGGFLFYRAREQGLIREIPFKWDLWQVILPNMRSWHKDDYELQIPMDISSAHLTYLASRLTFDHE